MFKPKQRIDTPSETKVYLVRWVKSARTPSKTWLYMTLREVTQSKTMLYLVRLIFGQSEKKCHVINFSDIFKGLTTLKRFVTFKNVQQLYIGHMGMMPSRDVTSINIKRIPTTKLTRGLAQLNQIKVVNNSVHQEIYQQVLQTSIIRHRIKQERS